MSYWGAANNDLADYTWAYGIDGDKIVGHYYDGNPKPFIYMPYLGENVFHWLVVPGTYGSYAYAHGVDGDRIVGYYEDSSGDRGFLATIVPAVPEPTTLSLLATGVLMACRRQRRR